MGAVPQLRFSDFEGEWKTERFSNLFSIGSGRDYKHLKTGKVPVYGTGGLMTYVNEWLYDGESVGIGRKGTIDKPVFLVGKFWTVDTLFFTHSFNGILPKFLFAIFQRENWKKHNEASGVPSLSKATIESIKVKLPAEEEQKKIAEFLGAVDEKIRLLQSRHEQLTLYKKGVMQKIFTQTLRFKADDGSDFPDWETTKLGDIATFSKGKGIAKADIIEDGKTECIRYGQLYTDYNETIDRVISRTNVNIEELILSDGNEVIIPASGETQIDIATASCVVRKGIALGGDLNIVKSKQNGVFLSYYLNSAKKIEIARLSQGISVVHIYASQLANLSVNIPALEEQQKIADFLSAIDNKIEAVSAKVEDIQSFKKGLLQQMFV